MALGRLIAKALLEGRQVRVEGFGTFSRHTPSAAVHDHEKHRIWTAPRDEIRFEPSGPSVEPAASDEARHA
jgi:nucleoid DNA-binding protein